MLAHGGECHLVIAKHRDLRAVGGANGEGWRVVEDDALHVRDVLEAQERELLRGEGRETFDGAHDPCSYRRSFSGVVLMAWRGSFASLISTVRTCGSTTGRTRSML